MIPRRGPTEICIVGSEGFALQKLVEARCICVRSLGLDQDNDCHYRRRWCFGSCNVRQICYTDGNEANRIIDKLLVLKVLGTNY